MEKPHCLRIPCIHDGQQLAVGRGRACLHQHRGARVDTLLPHEKEQSSVSALLLEHVLWDSLTVPTSPWSNKRKVNITPTLQVKKQVQ